MAFWTEQDSQPKRNYRFRVTLGGAVGQVVWWAKGFKPPSYEISEATHDYLDNKYYFPGRLTWGDCSMTLVDPQSPDAVGLTNQIIIDSGYKVKDKSSLTTISKKAAVGTPNKGLESVTIDIIDASGTAIETWELKNAWIKGVTFSDLAYDNDELRTIDITFRYDWAVHNSTTNPNQFKVS